MYFIKNCPYCTKALRFPIDRGKILVRCGCGHSFVADPDDPLLYRDGRFDLGAGKCRKKKARGVQSRSERMKLSSIRRWFISFLYELRYSVQNYRLLTKSDRLRLMLQLLAVFVFLSALISTIMIFVTR